MPVDITGTTLLNLSSILRLIAVEYVRSAGTDDSTDYTLIIYSVSNTIVFAVIFFVSFLVSPNTSLAHTWARCPDGHGSLPGEIHSSL